MTLQEKDEFYSDVARVVTDLPDDCSTLVNRNLLVTGASGFVSTWLVATWLEAERRFGGSGTLTLSCRNISEIALRFNGITQHPKVKFHPADIRSLRLSEKDKFDLVLHAAASASDNLNRRDPLEMIDTIISGTRNLLKLISVTKTTRFVNLSSGAIYGRCSNGSVRFAETFCGGPDLSNSLNAYHEAKRLSELLVRIECDKIGVSHVSLRLFTFIAPYLPLNTHFAAGNFILNALRGEDIVVQSGGGSIRTFQYGSDLTKYLICALTRDLRHDVYNVGSPTPFTIRELAEVVRNCLNPDGKVKIAGVDSDLNFSVYVPEVKRVVEEFGFTDSISLEAAVMRTASWYSKRVIT